jgi:DNA invertase Pin-like site-specific DNA recombinase
MTTAVYIRVSTVGQNEHGQRHEIERWLRGNGLSDARWYIDKASGKSLDRPEFARLQRDIFHGEIDTVVLWKLDRLSRNLRDGLNVLIDWCDRGLRVVSTTQQIDFNGSLGKMLAAVLLGVAEMEQETRRERQAAGIKAARERGVYLGRRPGTTKAKPSRARKLRQRGLTDSEIARALGVSRRTIQRYLKHNRSHQTPPDKPANQS